MAYDEPASELVQVHRSRSLRDARQHALVLTAVGIRSRLWPDTEGVGLYVIAEDAPRALAELDAYRRENAEPSRRMPVPAERELRAVAAAAVYAMVLLFVNGAAMRGLWGLDWVAAGAAEAGRILGGEPWRAVTALTLHADLGHLLNNLVFGTLFGVLTAQLLGTGVAWLAIVAAGALGNLLNAGLQPPDHTAIGASTAVFGAVGVLAGAVQTAGVTPWRPGLRRWAPVLAGLMLLAFLGFGGGRTDVGAHVAGFAVGIAIGCGLGWRVPQLPPALRWQAWSGAAALGVLALAWLAAL